MESLGKRSKEAWKRAKEFFVTNGARLVVVSPSVMLDASRQVVEPWQSVNGMEQRIGVDQKIWKTKEPRDFRKIIN